MNWQFWTGTGVFAGTTATLLYVRWRATRSVRPSRLARRVLAALARDVGQSVSTIELGRRVDAPQSTVYESLVDLIELELVEVAGGNVVTANFYYAQYQLTARGVVEAQRGVRGQHGRHR